MAYQIDRYNNSILTVVEDGTVDTTTDLKFIGKNYAGYGEIQNENFLFLLENFSGANPPPRAISGQMWYDSSANKLKFYDGNKWRTTGGAEVSATNPTGLSQGDFWWDTANKQLYVFDGTNFILIGPQNAGEGVTQMRSREVLDTGGTPHTIIEAVLSDEVISIISATAFQLAESNPIAGFSKIKKGTTLVNTPDTGITSSDHRFWGTASNSLRLGDVLAADYLRKNSQNQVDLLDVSVTKFADGGFTVGDSLDLKVRIEQAAGCLQGAGIIEHAVGAQSKIAFKTTDGSSALQHIMTVQNEGLMPSTDNALSLGSSLLKWNTVYASTFDGEATKAATLRGSGGSFLPTSAEQRPLSAPNGTIVVRTADYKIRAVTFEGRATEAQYADLAENYTTDEEYPVGTAMCVGGDAEATSCKASCVCIGVISEKPAYLMNSAAEGQAIGLKGRVPVRVKGPVSKGQSVYAWEDGICTTIASTAFVGVALESSNDEGEKLVECVLKV
jgi:hypothetical protein